MEDSILSLFVLFIYGLIFYGLFNWLILKGVWNGDANSCRVSSGACVSFLKEKFSFIIFGVYPREHIFRPILGLLLLVCGWVHLTNKKNWNKFIFLKLFFIILVYVLLLVGVGKHEVPTSKLGGLPLTLLLSSIGVLVSYPLGILLALGRTSNIVTFKWPCTVFIEIIRGVPLISVLFMASVMIPLFLPQGLNFDKVLRAQLAIIFFSSAYFAEVVRGGLNSIPKGQWEAGSSLGLSYYQIVVNIVLPQALVKVIPPTINTIIGMFKDTSLVIVIALFDLMGTTKASMTDSLWLGFSLEAYFLCAVIYYIICSRMGAFSRKVESEFMLKKQRSIND